MNVRRPEWDEHPLNPMVRNALLNQTTMLSAVMGPPRSDRTTAAELIETSRQAMSARRRSACAGTTGPLPFLAALLWSSMVKPTWPRGSRTMSHVKFAISPARRPAFADSNTMTSLRVGLRERRANASRSLTSLLDSTFACLQAIGDQLD